MSNQWQVVHHKQQISSQQSSKGLELDGQLGFMREHMVPIIGLRALLQIYPLCQQQDLNLQVLTLLWYLRALR